MGCLTPCDTCAFEPGTVTHDREPHNHLKALICLLAGLPFHCHYLKDGRDIHADPAYHERMTAGEARQHGFEICAGWKREIKLLADAGYFKERRMVTKANGIIGLDELYVFLNSEGEDKEDARLQLEKVMTWFGEKRRKFMGEEPDALRLIEEAEREGEREIYGCAIDESCGAELDEERNDDEQERNSESVFFV